MNRTNPLAVALILALLATVCLLWMLPSGRQAPSANRVDGSTTKELVLFCAAGMRIPVEKIAADYKKDFGTEIRVQYGGSNTLLSQLEIAQQGDLFLAADDSYLFFARKKGLVAEILPIAEMTAVLGVPHGNPRNIASLDDLKECRLAMANPDQAAIGKVAREMLQQHGRWEEIDQLVRNRGVYKPTVGDVANDIKLQSADAGLLWDAIAHQLPEIDVVRLPELEGAEANIGVGVLTASSSPTKALHFARYLTARDKGLPTMEGGGYKVVVGDSWAEKPELTFYSGAVNRKAVDPIIRSFAEREGVVINTVYNGCGILNAQLASLGSAHELFPDAYMPCDVYYLDEVADHFGGGKKISSTRIVLVVAEGNPKQIGSLTDLTRDGVRVALGQPDQCTIGILSKRLLEAEGIYADLLSTNVVTQTASSSLLVPSVVTGAADVALAYETDAQSESDRLDMVRIDSPLARAVQPYGIAHSSEHPQLMKRLRDRIAASRDAFERLGFGWEVKMTRE